MDLLQKSRSSSVTGVTVAVLALVLVAAAIFAAEGPSGRVTAQDVPRGTPTPEPTTLQVSGHGSVSLAPDTAAVAVGVTITAGSLAEAQAQATAKMNAILAVVEAAGVAAEDVVTVRYSVTLLYDRDREGNRTAITGYEVTNQIGVKVRDFAKLGELLDAVVAAGANSVGGVRFYVENPSAAASQARRLAVEEALAKATEVADAAGLRVARIVSIAERSAPRPAAVPFEAGDAPAPPSAAEAPVPIEAGTTEVAVDLDVQFELR